MSKKKTDNPFTGRWRIVSMPGWDEDYLDEEVLAFIEFEDKEVGRFHFGNVQGHMDCRLTTRDGEPAMEWSWDGNAEMDAAQGRGWAVLRGDELHGMIFLHMADDSEFMARRIKPGRRSKRP